MRKRVGVLTKAEYDARIANINKAQQARSIGDLSAQLGLVKSSKQTEEKMNEKNGFKQQQEREIKAMAKYPQANKLVKHIPAGFNQLVDAIYGIGTSVGRSKHVVLESKLQIARAKYRVWKKRRERIRLCEEEEDMLTKELGRATIDNPASQIEDRETLQEKQRQRLYGRRLKHTIARLAEYQRPIRKLYGHVLHDAHDFFSAMDWDEDEIVTRDDWHDAIARLGIGVSNPSAGRNRMKWREAKTAHDIRMTGTNIQHDPIKHEEEIEPEKPLRWHDANGLDLSIKMVDDLMCYFDRDRSGVIERMELVSVLESAVKSAKAATVICDWFRTFYTIDKRGRRHFQKSRKGISNDPQQKEGAFWNSDGDAKRRIDAQHRASNMLANGPFSSDWRVESFIYEDWAEERQATFYGEQRERRKYQKKLFDEKTKRQLRSPTPPETPRRTLRRPSPRPMSVITLPK